MTAHHFLLRFGSRWFVVSLLAVAGLVVAGCDDASLDPSSTPETSPSDQPLSPDVRLQIAYDQTEATYASVWPQVIVGNESKSSKSEDEAVYMTEYEKTREVRSYDQDGYLTSSYEFVEGHPGMNMPADAYNDLKPDMPYNPQDENPVVRSELKGNTMTVYREDGSIARQRPVDPEAFRLSPAELDSLKTLAESNATIDERRQRARRSLQARGASLRQLDENRVSFTQSVSNAGGVSSVEKVVDLRIGEPIYLKYRLKNGNTDMVQTRRYGFYNGVPFPTRKVTYSYDDRSGTWGVVSRTEVVRKNVSIRFN